MKKRDFYFSDMDRLGVDYDGKCVIVVDTGMFFPYSNQETCKGLFWFSEAPEAALKKPSGYQKQCSRLLNKGLVFNNRYSNKGFVTLSERYGRKVSRGGVYLVCDPGMLSRMKYVNICYTVSSKPVGDWDKVPTVSFPVTVEPWDDTGIVFLGIRINLDDPNKPLFDIFVHMDNPCAKFFYQKRYHYTNNNDMLPSDRHEQMVFSVDKSDMEHYGAVSTTVLELKQWRKDYDG